MTLCLFCCFTRKEQYFRYILAVMRRRKSEPTLLPTRGICDLPHHIGDGMRGTGRWWCCKLYTAGKWTAAQLYVMAVTGFITRVTKPTELSSHTQHYKGLRWLWTGTSRNTSWYHLTERSVKFWWNHRVRIPADSNLLTPIEGTALWEKHTKDAHQFRKVFKQPA